MSIPLGRLAAGRRPRAPGREMPRTKVCRVRRWASHEDTKTRRRGTGDGRRETSITRRHEDTKRRRHEETGDGRRETGDGYHTKTRRHEDGRRASHEDAKTRRDGRHEDAKRWETRTGDGYHTKTRRHEDGGRGSHEDTKTRRRGTRITRRHEDAKRRETRRRQEMGDEDGRRVPHEDAKIRRDGHHTKTRRHEDTETRRDGNDTLHISCMCLSTPTPDGADGDRGRTHRWRSCYGAWWRTRRSRGRCECWRAARQVELADVGTRLRRWHPCAGCAGFGA
jgi:hypothetical protein